jgi:hypothetical protein
MNYYDELVMYLFLLIYMKFCPLKYYQYLYRVPLLGITILINWTYYRLVPFRGHVKLSIHSHNQKKHGFSTD